MTAVNPQINAGANDVTLAHYGNSFSITGSFISLGTYGGYEYESAFRFSLNVPKDATINSAYLSFRASSTRAGTGSWTVDAESADSAAAITTSADFFSRSRTTASASCALTETWTANSWYNVGDISAVIEEIVGRAGWVANNYINLFVPTNYTSCPTRFVNSYESNSSYGAKLYVDYTEGGGGGISIPVVMHQLRQQGIA